MVSEGFNLLSVGERMNRHRFGEDADVLYHGPLYVSERLFISRSLRSAIASRERTQQSISAERPNHLLTIGETSVIGIISVRHVKERVKYGAVSGPVLASYHG